MQFNYRAYNSGGGVVTGFLEGMNEQEVISKLGDKDLMIVTLKHVEIKEHRHKAPRIKIPLTVLSPFTRQLATMLRAGLSLIRCLDSLGRQSKHPGLQTVLQKLTKAVEGGAAFSEALRSYPSVFST